MLDLMKTISEDHKITCDSCGQDVIITEEWRYAKFGEVECRIFKCSNHSLPRFEDL